MTSELTITVNYEKPKNGAAYVLAKYSASSGASVWERIYVQNNWKCFEWWCEIPTPVKPRLFVVQCYDHLGETRYRVHSTDRTGWFACAIPNPEAAQAIADIYEANQ